MNLKRSLALAISVLMILTMPFAFGAGETLDRIAGSNRWETAVKISQEGWTAANVVVLANGRNYPDALAGVPLAHSLNAPVLLTEADSLVAATKAEITRLDAGKVIILGGTGVISEAVENELKGMNLTVERIKGADRFETAAAIAAKVSPGGSGTVVLASGRGYADALAAGSYAAINGYPILLTEKNSLPDATKKAIEDLGATKIIVVGGTGVIADSAITGLTGVTRVSGSNREATSVELAKYFALATQKYFIATGDGFADAITGAVLAAKEGTGILLVRAVFPAVVGDFFAANNVANAVIFGGTGSVSDVVAKAAAAKLVQAPSGIAGFVNDGGTAVKDAVVGVAGKEAKTDADGFYQITGVAPGKYNVTVSKPGRAINTEPGFVVAQNKVATLNLDLGTALPDGVSIAGVVYDVDTLAGVDAIVTVNKWDKDLAKWVFVEEDVVDPATSKFTVTSTALKTDTEYQVIISKDVVDFPDEAYVAQTRTIKTSPYEVANSFTQPFALKAVKPVTISGTALDKAGEKIPDLTWVDLYLGEVWLTGAQVASGEYAFEDLTLPSGTYTIVTELTDNAIYTANVAISEGVDKTHNIKLVAGYAFDFVLAADPIGSTLVGSVEAQVYQGTTKVGAAVSGVLAGDSKSALFAMTELYPAGSYQVEVSGDFIITAKFPVTISKAGQGFTNRTKLAGSVSGSVASGGTDIDKAGVKLVNSAGKEIASTKTDASGSFTFTGVPAGKYKVTVSHPEYVTKTSAEFTVAVTADFAVPAFDLKPVATNGTLEGYLREVGSMELVGASVTFIDKDKTEHAATVTDCHYEISLAPGTYTVLVQKIDSHEIIVDTVKVVASTTPVVKHYLLTPGADASLTIKSIKNAKGEDITIDDADFLLSDAYGNDWLPTDGSFTGLPAGAYTLTATTPAGYLNVEQSVTIAKSTPREISLLLVNSNTVTVPVYGFTFPGSSLADATVAAFDATGKMVGGYETTDVNGEAVFELVNGTYTFKVYADDHFVGEAKATIEKDVTIDVIYVEMF